MDAAHIEAELIVNTVALEHARAKVGVLMARRKKLYQHGLKAGMTWATMGRASKLDPTAVYREALGRK